MLTADHVTVAYGSGPTRTKVLDDLGLHAAGTTSAITGPSGSGKSTLLRVLSGLQRPTAGTVQIDGRPVTWSAAGTVDPRVSVIYQDFRLIDFLTVEENLSVAVSLRGTEPDSRALDRAVDLVGISHLRGRLPGLLSGGEQQRAAIARAVLTRSRILLADEPTGALDAGNSANVAQLLDRVAREDGLTVIVATHDVDVAQTMATGYALDGGALRRTW